MLTGKATTAAAAAAAATRQQEDAQEFLNFLLDSTHQELLRLRALHAGSLGDPGGFPRTSPPLNVQHSSSHQKLVCKKHPDFSCFETSLFSGNTVLSCDLSTSVQALR